MNTSDIGLIGLAVMGENLVLNMESKGYTVSVFNRTTEVTDKFAAGRAKGKKIVPTRSIEEFVGTLVRPRKAMIMVKAGSAVDAVIDQLLPHLDRGDVIIDGGNSLFLDTQRRDKALAEKGIHFMGIGVSGGEEGALKGPSMMPGGSETAWQIVAPICQKIAAQVDGEPCCRYMGPDGAGHYVKMVHNGIEYGDMQLICEAYAILRDLLGLTPKELHDVFADWNRGIRRAALLGSNQGDREEWHRLHRSAACPHTRCRCAPFSRSGLLRPAPCTDSKVLHLLGLLFFDRSARRFATRFPIHPASSMVLSARLPPLQRPRYP